MKTFCQPLFVQQRLHVMGTFWAMFSLIFLHSFTSRELMFSVISYQGALLVLCLAQGQNGELSLQQIIKFV